MTSKVTTLTNDPSVTKEDVAYEYNLQNRLERVTTTPYISNVAQTQIVVEYAYNTQGIRTSKDVDGTVTDYLIDPSNHTGYAQVLEETTAGVRTTYTIGDDIIAQSTSGVTDYLLYDGHGSTRQLADSTGAIVSGQEYSYDGFGVMLSDSTTSGAEAAAAAGTKMLYAGEQYDASASMYYNRARYYNQSNGTFNRVDPYSGNTQDPQSLHKYAYCHNNPINAIDPSGMMALATQITTISIVTIGMTIAINGLLFQQIRVSSRSVAQQAAEREIKMFIQMAQSAFTQEQFDELQNKIKTITRRYGDKSLYLHYSFTDIANVFGNVSGLRAPSWCTRTVYPTGWEAKYYLALHRRGPRDAVYVVLPSEQDEVQYDDLAIGQVDQYIHNLGNWLPGGGQEWQFPNGTSPGTVFGPIPIPKGTRPN